MLPRRSPRLIQQAEKDGKRYVETTEIQAEERAATVIVTQETAATGVAERAVEEESQIQCSWRELRRESRLVGALAAKQEARAVVGAFVAKVPRAAHHGSSPLPPDVWSRVFSFLAASTCRDPHRGAAAISRDIASASRACRDMHVAAAGAWRQLEEAGPSTCSGVPYGLWSLSGGMTWEEWDKVFRNPNGCVVPLLKKAAKALGLRVSGTKAELVVRVYKEIGLKEPIGATAKLWVAFRADKREAWAWEWEQRQKEAEQRRKEMQAQRKRELQQQGLMCACGNTTSAACSTKKCGKCCQGPCARHKKR